MRSLPASTPAFDAAGADDRAAVLPTGARTDRERTGGVSWDQAVITESLAAAHISPTTAMHSISTRAASARPLLAIALRAGRLFGKNCT
jgi:hypothetical protein